MNLARIKDDKGRLHEVSLPAYYQDGPFVYKIKSDTECVCVCTMRGSYRIEQIYPCTVFSGDTRDLKMIGAISFENIYNSVAINLGMVGISEIGAIVLISEN